MNAQLAFVLPLTLKERINAGFADLGWRSNQDAGVLFRTHVLLTSFIKNFRQGDLSEFVIVCPDVDMSPV